MPLSPVREVHSPTSAAAAQRQIEMRQLFSSPATRGAASQPLAAGRGFELANGRADRAPRQERGGRHGQRGARRRAERAHRDGPEQPNGVSAPRGLLSAALGQQAEPMEAVLSSSPASVPAASDAPLAEGGTAHVSRSLTDLGAGFRGRGRGGRGRRHRESASPAPPELEMVSLAVAAVPPVPPVPPVLASVASSDTASTVSAPSGHASRTDTDTGAGRQHGRGDGGHGRSRCAISACAAFTLCSASAHLPMACISIGCSATTSVQ